MNNLLPLALAALLFSSSACMSHSHGSHAFADRAGQLPNVNDLEQARQENMANKKSSSLGDAAWYPLIALNTEVYGPSDEAWPNGTSYINFAAYGPLFSFVDVETMHYDEQQKLYERNLRTSYLWGLWRTQRDDVRVPSGWRQSAETSILFGLLSWPCQIYVDQVLWDEPASSAPESRGAHALPAAK